MSQSSSFKAALPSDADASGRSFAAEELELLRQVIESGTLNCTKGTVTRQFEERFAASIGTPFCRTTSSGTAAVHTALAAIDPTPGDEVITTPITDMGAITPILYQTAIPVFAAVDPLTYNVTAETIAAKITRRTKAVIVTHLFGNCCDMQPILDLCSGKGIPVIEDCAQAFGSTYRDRPVSTMGAIGCFSLQQGKHMTSGEGGMVVTSDESLARRMRLFIDKAWGYGDPNPDHYFLALNYRLTELQGAVALAQFGKLPEMVQQRIDMAGLMTEKIAGIPGVSAPEITPASRHVYWKYPLRVDPEVIRGGADEFGSRLKANGVFCAPRYTRKLAFECQVLKERKTFGDSEFPFRGPQRAGEPDVTYDTADTPQAVRALLGVVVLPWNEKYTAEHVDFIADVVRQTGQELAR